MLILSLQHIPKAKGTRFNNYMLLKFEAETTNLRPRSKGPKAEAKGSKPRPRPKPEVTRPMPKFWPRGFNISVCH